MTAGTPPSSGFFERTFTRLFMRAARVSAVEAPSPHFRFIDFEGDALRECIWLPGQKVQIKLDRGMDTRTFTPMSWDARHGTTRILVYAHGAGPGSDWARAVAAGDERQIFGPRRSLDPESLPDTVVLFGDETSFGLAAALHARGADPRRVHHVFEVSSQAESRPILDGLGLGAVETFERRPEEAHLADIQTAVLRFADTAAHFILTGKAQSIQHVSRALKQRATPLRRISAKAYWAPGKRGLD